MTIVKFAGAAALLLAAGCDVTVNNESVGDQADALGDRIENAAESAGNRIDSAADAVEAKAERIGDIDVNVDLDGNRNGNHDGNAADGESNASVAAGATSNTN